MIGRFCLVMERMSDAINFGFIGHAEVFSNEIFLRAVCLLIGNISDHLFLVPPCVRKSSVVIQPAGEFRETAFLLFSCRQIADPVIKSS